MSRLTPDEQRAWAHATASHASALSPEDRAAWANARPMGAAEDSGRSFITGIERAGNGIAGTPAMVRDVFENLPQAAQGATDWLLKQTGMLPDTPAAPHQDPPMRPGDLAAILAKTFPTQAQLDTRTQTQLGPYHTPQTWQGRTAQTVAENVPSALLPGGPVARVGRVLVPALASSAAGEATHGTKYEKAARVAGGVAGGLVEGGIEAAANAPSRIMGNAARSLTPEQAAMVAQLRDGAAREGISLTVPEAVQQVTNGATSLGRVQRLVENASPTAERMAGYFAPRPDQMRGAVMNAADDLAPGAADMAPGMLGADVNRAANGALMSANHARSAATGPAYAAIAQDTVEPGAMAGVLDRIQSQITGDRTGLLTPTLTRLRDSLTQGGAPILDQGNLSTARNYWRDFIDLPPTGQDPLTKYQAGIIGDHLDSLDALLKAHPGRQAADAAYAAASRQMVEPVASGPVGAIARTNDLGAQTAALFPANPPLGQAGETTTALQALNGQDDQLARALLRQHIGNTFNQSTRELSGGPNQYGGALFAKNVAGNAEQGATLRAGLDAADPSGVAGDRVDALLEALRATGRRERPGSMTAFNENDINALKQAPAAIKLFGALGDPLEWTKNLSNWTGGRLYGRNLNMLADMLTDPDTAAVLQRAQAARSPAAGMPLALLPAAAAGAAQ